MHLRSHRLVDNLICQVSHLKNRKRFRQLRTQKYEYSVEGFDRLKCIYIHIPKVAGISINNALFGNYGGGHKTVHTYKRIFGPRLYRKYYSFTFVRNPFSRILSAYRFLKSGGFGERDQNWAAENLSAVFTFDEFVREWIDEKSIWTKLHFKPQYSFVCDIHRKPEVDFVGKFETLREDYKKVCRKLEIENRLPHINKGPTDNTNWMESYTDYSLDKVFDIYNRDFEIFHYSKSRR